MTSTSSNRPYFNKNIEELSALVQANRENKKVLKQLLHELSFRSRPKAKALAKTVGVLLETETGHEQLTLPLKASTGIGHKGCAPEPYATSSEADLGEAPTPNAPYQETMSDVGWREAPLAADADYPQQPESLWGKLMAWFKSR